ncbi:uncharacterized protein LOC129719215 [Wyeomyia smithii]|uniref:uncharacterized protein LOC129719215 n=1 Tax=Wyeomyia smithii TaxID=174621 RepID=UPI002467CE2F|nr:uncharacterized protein LOC129719215 [Wyeomyia smithii]
MDCSSCRSLYELEMVKRKNLQCSLSEEQQRRRRFQRICYRQKQALVNNNAKIQQLKKQLKASQAKEKKGNKLLKTLKCNPILLESMKNFRINKNARRYPSMKYTATCQRINSGSAYKNLRAAGVLCMPHPKSITRWQQSVTLEPGCNLEIIRRMSIIASGLQERDKLIVLLIDGMALKPTIGFHAKSDFFYGLPNDGVFKVNEENDTANLANEAITIMARGVGTKYKQTFGYFLANTTLSCTRQQEIIEESVRTMFKIGFIPVGIVMDQHPTNVMTARAIGVTVDKPMFDIDGHPVLFFFDAPHLFKSLRNNLFNKNVLFQDEIVSFQHIRELYKMDISKMPRLVPKLTQKAVELPAFSKMNVKLATQTLSGTTAKAINTYVELQCLEKEVLPTALFIELFDQLFDVFNSRFKFNSAKLLFILFNCQFMISFSFMNILYIVYS